MSLCETCFPHKSAYYDFLAVLRAEVLKNVVIVAAAAATASATAANRSTAAAYAVRALTRAEDLTYRLPRDSISGGTSIPSRNRRAGAESGGERASKRAPAAAAATAVRVPTLSRRRTHGRARVLDRIRPLIGFRGLIKSRSEREKRKEEETDDDEDARLRVRRRYDDGGGGGSGDGGDDLLSRAFARTREIADLRHALPAKSGRFASVNAFAESRRTRGQTERKRAKRKEEDREE